MIARMRMSVFKRLWIKCKFNKSKKQSFWAVFPVTISFIFTVFFPLETSLSDPTKEYKDHL